MNKYLFNCCSGNSFSLLELRLLMGTYGAPVAWHLTGQYRSTRTKICSASTIYTTNLTWISIYEKPSLRGERPANNSLSYRIHSFAAFSSSSLCYTDMKRSTAGKHAWTVNSKFTKRMCNIPENFDLQQHLCKNLKYSKCITYCHDGTELVAWAK